MPAKASVPGLTRTFFALFETGETFLTRTRLHIRHLLDNVKNIIHDAYHAASRYTTNTATRIANLVEVCTLKL